MKTGIKFLGMSFMAFALTACGGAAESSSENTEAPAAEAAVEAPAKMDYMIDTEKSAVSWAGEMMGVYTHTGTLSFSEGSVSVENGAITGGMFAVDMTTMSPTDANYKDEDGGRSSDLVGHLSSPDFFNVAEFPSAALTITGAGEEGLMADLTIRGKTNSEVITDITMDAEAGTASGKMTIDRRKYDVVWDHPMKEMVLSDNITMDVQLVMAQ
jgi:polyisoprenoid-binding protein YceI